MENQSFLYVNNNKVCIDYKNLWANKGHRLGIGFISPDQKHFYLSIPKNASSFTEECLLEIGWAHSNIENYLKLNNYNIDNQINRIIVPLRDPLERWISRLITYCHVYHTSSFALFLNNSHVTLPIKDKLAWSIMLDHITFDDHTERQCMFLLDIPDIQKCTYLNVDENFNLNFNSLLNELEFKTNFKDKARVNAIGYQAKQLKNTSEYKLISLLNHHFTQTPELKEKIEKWFECDYQLIRQIKFYNG